MSTDMKLLVTGGAGFIGSAVVRLAVARGIQVANLDNVAPVADSPLYTFERADICDADALATIFTCHAPTHVMHLADESHVDRSIDGPGAFMQTNMIGTFKMLQAARGAGVARFHLLPTDEVFGTLGAAAKTRPMTPARSTRRPAIIWCAPGAKPTACRLC